MLRVFDVEHREVHVVEVGVLLYLVIYENATLGIHTAAKAAVVGWRRSEF